MGWMGFFSQINIMRIRYLFLYVILSAFLCASCGNKRQDSKQSLLDNIEHFHVDTIDVTNKEPIGTPSLDEVLRHYPELYHATEKARIAYRKWVDREKEMIATAFVGKNTSRMSKASKYAAKLEKRIVENDVTALLEYALLDSNHNDIGTLDWVDDKLTTQHYLFIMGKVKDGLQDDANHSKTDEIKTSIGFARRTWIEYIDALRCVEQALPDNAREYYVMAANKMMQKHLVDLYNRYFQYYDGTTPGWLLKEGATDEQIQQFVFCGLQGIDWME